MTRRRPAVVVRIPGAPPKYNQNEEAQFRGVVENALTTFQNDLAAEPLFLDAFASIDADGDLNFEYKLNAPYGISIGYAWEATSDDAGATLPTDASITDGSHANYAVSNSDDALVEVVAAKATAAGDEVFLKVIAFSDVSATGRSGQIAEFHLVVEIPGGAGSIPDGTIIADKLTDQGRRFTTDIVFSATDDDTVAWTSGTMQLANGDTFSITGSNTGNMAALTYIYLDRTASTTLLQTSTNYAAVASDDVILLAVAKKAADGSQKAFFVPGVGVFGLNEENLSPNAISATEIQTDAVTTPKLVTNAIIASKITAGSVETAKIKALNVTVDQIAGNTITAAKMNVVILSALSADVGTLNAGIIQNGADPTNKFIDMDATGVEEFIKFGTTFQLLADGTATFGGTVSATSFTGSTATFDGSVEVKGGTGSVSAKIVTFAFEVYDSGGTKTTTVGLSGSNSRIQAEQGDMQVNCSTSTGDVKLHPGSSGFVDFNGNTATAGAIAGYIKCKINGTERRMAYYATS